MRGRVLRWVWASLMMLAVFGAVLTVPITLGAWAAYARAAGETFQDCSACPVMVVVPAGRFRMGDLSEVGEPNELPVHQVTFAQPFAVGKYEITCQEWQACVSARRCRNAVGSGTHPATGVTWKDAKAYVSWLSDKTRKTYRLLSEAEWEYAARAGSVTPFQVGKMISATDANFNGLRTFNGSARGIYRKKALPVGSFPPNAFGLHDFHGNVGEWVEDCWNPDYRGAPSNGAAWTEAPSCVLRVIRGGSWASPPSDLRTASRNWFVTKDKDVYFGLRVARGL